MQGLLVQSRVSQHLFSDYYKKNRTPVNFLLKNTSSDDECNKDRVMMLTAVSGMFSAQEIEFQQCIAWKTPVPK